MGKFKSDDGGGDGGEVVGSQISSEGIAIEALSESILDSSEEVSDPLLVELSEDLESLEGIGGSLNASLLTSTVGEETRALLNESLEVGSSVRGVGGLGSEAGKGDKSLSDYYNMISK